MNAAILEVVKKCCDSGAEHGRHHTIMLIAVRGQLKAELRILWAVEKQQEDRYLRVVVLLVAGI